MMIRERKTVLSFLLFSTFLCASSVARAELVPIDELQDRLHPKKRNPKISRLAQGFDLLGAGKTAEARKIARGFTKDPVFADYAYQLSSSADMKEAQNALKGNGQQLVISLAQRAITAQLKIVEAYPLSPFHASTAKTIANAEVIVATAFCSIKTWKDCKLHFENAFQRLSHSSTLGELRPEALHSYGEACVKEKSESCNAWIRRFAAYFPKSSPELAALNDALPEDVERVRPPSIGAKTVKIYRGPELDVADFDLAMEKYLSQHYGDAAAGFRKFLDDFPKSAFRFRAQYWLAQSLSHEQKHQDAQKIYEHLQSESPLTYYGLLASFATGKEVSTLIDATVPKGNSTDPFLSALELYRIKRAETLISGGAETLAAHELKELKPRDALSSPFLLYLAVLNHEAHNHLSAFMILRELGQRGGVGLLSSYALRLIFPVEYLELIEAAAKENQLDPVLLLSLIKQESSFEVSAVSSSGAQGLMQLMPTTALDVTPDVIRNDLVGAKINIQTGAKYLARLMNRFNGNVVYALAGYNAGPSAVDRWVKASPAKRGMLEFIESIPFRETREYVASIVRNHFWYSRRLNPDNVKTLSYFWNVYGPPEKSSSAIKKTSTSAAD